MKRISIDDLTGFADICECEWLLGELVAGCSEPPYNPFNDVKQDPSFLKFQEEVYNDFQPKDDSTSKVNPGDRKNNSTYCGNNAGGGTPSK